ncbi:MAG: glycosyltransferase [Chloroflexota bacterium]
MRAIVAASARFVIDKDNNLWTASQSLGTVFWQRYLDVYDAIYLMVRAKPVEHTPDNYVLATGENIDALPLPYYHGTSQFLKQFFQIREAIRTKMRADVAVHLRVPLLTASMILKVLPATYPYGVEVVGDPHDVFSPNAIQHPLRPILRQWYARELRKLCKQAHTTAYVTETALQKRYPPAENTFTTHFSSIELNDTAFASEPRYFEQSPIPIKLITVGGFDQLYKAQDILIQAVIACRQRGLDIRLTLVGDGTQRMILKTLASDISEFVTFTGNLRAGDEVREQLQQSDVFVLPSRQEGLPRAMIEAMAIGLPCIGSEVGGFSELLAKEDLVPPNNVQALAAKIMAVAHDPVRLSQMAKRNFKRAQAYHIDYLRERRIAFYQSVREATLKWQKM